MLLQKSVAACRLAGCKSWLLHSIFWPSCLRICLMKKQPIKDQCCNNPNCHLHGQFNQGNIKLHSFYTTKQGRRRRYCCKICGKTFCSTSSTAYYRLHKPRKLFDEVAQMSVEGLRKSGISRIKGISWNTVASWQQKSAEFARQTNRIYCTTTNL